MFQFGVWASPCFHFYATLLAVLMVCKNWPERKLRRLEPWIQGTTWVFALAVAVVPIPFGLYNPVPRFCWLFPYPYGCTESFGSTETDCIRGGNIAPLQFALTLFPMWPCVIGCTICLCYIYAAVRRMEARNHIHDFTASTRSMHSAQEPDTSLSRVVASRAMWLIFSFFFVYSFDLTRQIIWNAFRYDDFNDWVWLVDYSIYPSQGIFNLIAFMKGRPTMLTPEGRFLRRLVFFNCRSRCCQRSKNMSEESTRTQYQEEEAPNALLEEEDEGSSSQYQEKEKGVPDVSPEEEDAGTSSPDDRGPDTCSTSIMEGKQDRKFKQVNDASSLEDKSTTSSHDQAAPDTMLTDAAAC
jgi:hypothetical protein